MQSKTLSILLAGAFVVWAAMLIFDRDPPIERVASQRSVPSSPQGDACTVDRVHVAVTRAGFVDGCRASPCPSMKGVGTITNTCSTPTGVEIQVTGLDAAGRPVSTKTLWPASTRNVPTGESPISLDLVLDYDPAIDRFDAKVVSVRRW